MEAVDMDPSTGAGFFPSEYKKHGDLKDMLDSNKDSLKLDAMKRIIGMVAKGRDASDLFPAVVKNVVSKNIEVKKLVYVYLTRYAEEQQDLALLSISTFQRALKDPNQMIRASALRVLSSIRVPVIVPIMLPAIKDSSVDMSPFVRKTACHAIPKLYSLDPDHKEELIGVIEKLLADRTTLVVGSAVMAFEEVCPERVDLIHKNFRKLVNLLVDVEEWGQVVIINMLTRYARTQFADPNQGDETSGQPVKEEFYEKSDDDESDVDVEVEVTNDMVKAYKMDPDHRLLLRSTKPLLQSRNASVVMSVAQMYWHLAPRPEIQVVAKALVRLLRSHNEVQAIVLNCITAMSLQTSGHNKMFHPFLRQFFIRASDPSHVKILKLEILTNLATEANIGILLREFQSYISSQDQACVAATVQAIGRCAASIAEVTDTCLTGLVHLLSNKDQAVVAEAVVEIKKLLQTQSREHKDIISHMARLVDTIDVVSARAAIVWVVGEYGERVPLIAPDVLRKMAKTFCNEDDEVKLQILNLAAKLCLTNPKQTRLLTQYVLNLAKYDQNYDIRDRARFIRALLFPAGESGKLSKHAKKIFLASKPAPTVESKFRNRDVYQLGSLSHFINARAAGYNDLPTYPAEPPDASVRNVEPPKPAENPWKKSEKQPKKATKKSTKFYDSDDNEVNGLNGVKSGTESGSDSGTSDSEDSSSSSDSDSSSSDSDSAPAKKPPPKKKPAKSAPKAAPVVKQKQAATPPPNSDDSSSGSDSSSDEPSKPVKPASKKAPKAAEPPKSNLDLLLDLSDIPPSMPTPILTPSLGGFFTPSGDGLVPTSASGTQNGAPSIGQPMHVSTTTTELLNKLTTGGVQVAYRFTRLPHLFNGAMVSVELTFTNLDSEAVPEIKIGSKALSSGMSIHDFPAFTNLLPNQDRVTTLGVDYNDTTQPAKFDIVIGGRPHPVTLAAPVGELLRPLNMPEVAFAEEQSKLRGMNEVSSSVTLPSVACDLKSIMSRTYQAANILQVPSSDSSLLRFAGQTVSGKSLVLVTLDQGKSQLQVSCEKMVIGSMLSREIKAALEKI